MALVLLAAPAGAQQAPRPVPPTLDGGLNEAFRAVKAGRFDEARRATDAYLAASPSHPGQAHFVAGLAYHQQKLYERAAARFAQAAELEPAYFTTFFFQGFALLNLGRLDESRRALERYLAIDEGYAEAHFGLGLVALEQDRVGEAERSLSRALELAGGAGPIEGLAPGQRRDLARYEARLADVHLRKDALEPARAALERALALWPEFFEPWHKLALVLRRQGDLAAAERAEARSGELLRTRQAGRQP